MSAKFSPTTSGVYPEDVYSTFPADALDIPLEEYARFKKGEYITFKISNGTVLGVPQPNADMLIPLVCSAYQIRAALNQLGWRQLVENAVANSADQDLKDAWQFSQSFTQDHPKVLQIAQSIGKTEADLQTLFELAITLNP
jgi:hypothetical protein